jgi:cytochrome c oxidase subunit 3
VSITLIFLGGIAAISVWFLSQQRLTSKPWLEEGPLGDLPFLSSSSLPPAKIGLGVFLAVVGSLFALLFSAFSMRMNMPGVTIGAARTIPPLALLWLNSGLLILSSAALLWAQFAARRGDVDGVRTGLFTGGILTFAFLAGQLLAWRQLSAEGYFLASNPASAFFYLITGVHGLHLLGGLVALGRAGAKAWGGLKIAQMRLSVELCAIYWHFLLLVWLIFFGLLLFTEPSSAFCSWSGL